MTTLEAASFLHLSKRCIDKYVKEGRLDAYKVLRGKPPRLLRLITVESVLAVREAARSSALYPSRRALLKQLESLSEEQLSKLLELAHLE